MISRVAGQRSDCGFKSSNWWRYDYKDGAEAVESLQRDSRRFNGNRFRRAYKSIVDGEKTLICSDGSTSSWSDKCYDKIWVGIQGKECICVVTLKHDVDQTMSHFAEAIMSEVECIPYNQPIGTFGCGTERPFSVVSVIPFDGGSGHQASSLMHDARNAVNFFKDKMKSNLAFTFEETVETAIAAFQHLCSRELKAEDIWVSTVWNLEGLTMDMKLPERKEYLDIISGASSGEGRLPKVPPNRPGVRFGKPIGNGLLATVSPMINFLGAYNHLTYSDEEDDSGGLFSNTRGSTALFG